MNSDGKAGNARLHVLIARDARRAVVFRRGPGKSVLVLAWTLTDDTLTIGQWLRGRIYERRCDLSPDGELLSYFAADFRNPLRTWTAVSRPPYLTALALWPKGDTWGGGGLFQDDRTLRLNHLPGPGMQLADGFAIPAGFKVAPLGDHSGRGEDDPIAAIRLARDGWTMAAAGNCPGHRGNAPIGQRIDPPAVLEKPLGRRDMVLRVSLRGTSKHHGARYRQTSRVVGPAGVLEDLGQVDWSDIDHNGDVLFARDGCLFRRPHRQLRSGVATREPPKLVADLNDLRFERRAAPGPAQSWPAPARARRGG